MAQSKTSEPQMAQSDKSHVQSHVQLRAVSLADEIDGLADLAKLYNIIANLVGEIKDTVEKRWKVATMEGFNARTNAVGDL